MLAVERLECFYGGARILDDLSLTLAPRQVLALLGRNGAGKTTTLKAIMGLVRPRAGSVRLDGQELTTRHPYKIPKLGLAYVPQGRGLFPSLTVEENLTIGLLVKGPGDETLGWVFELFPGLTPRLRQRAGTLSGGEQQMLSVARALCARPRYLLLDEPTEGLMPILVRSLLDTIRALRSHGVGVLLVEQKIDAALRVADTVALLEHGRIQYQATPAELASSPEILVRYLGVTRSEF